MLPVGSMVAGYRVERVLGTGGMGTVYLAKNPTLPRYDAVKVLSAELSADDGFRERFVREADVASVLHHPNIVSIYSRGETDDGQLWIAMQYVHGTDAEAALRSGTMTPARALHIVTEVGKALDYAHQRNVVHHDVKPANFLLASEVGEHEHVLLGDFGVARALDDVNMSMDGSLMATLTYAAPEVIAGNPIDGRSDLYSLACTLFRLLTGKKPFFEANGTAEVMRAHLHQDPPQISRYLPWSSPQLDWVMAKALAKDPAHRFPSAREFTHAAGVAVHEAMSAPPTDPVRLSPPAPINPRPQQPTPGGNSRVPLLIGAAAVVAVLLIGGVFWLLRPSPATTSAPPAAPSPDPEAQAQLADLIPPGYPTDTCKPVPPPDGALAKVSCGQNIDPGGPPSATYTLAADSTALRDGFDEIVTSSSMVNCPGGIQSPGPWRRNATPKVTAGTLFCGVQQNSPTVAWTDDEELLLSEVQTEPNGPTLAQLYAWWSSHS